MTSMPRSIKRVKTHGGAILSDVMSVETVGRMAVVQDNTGGLFGVITPSDR